jgi:polyisoprenoid-binding protein YceI
MSATTWTIDSDHSQVGFAVKHMMFTKVRGEFTEVEGSLDLDLDGGTDGSVRVEIDAASIDTGTEDRDGHLRSADFLDVENHPKIVFESTRVEGNPTEQGGSFQVVGDLTIRDETREVTLDVTFDGTGQDPWGGTRAGFSASTRIDRRDFGLTWNQALETGGVLVGNQVEIELEVQAVAQEEAHAGAA